MNIPKLVMVIALCWAFESVAAAQTTLVGSIGKVYGGDAQVSSGTWAVALGGGGARAIGSELEFAQTGHFTDLFGNQSKVLSLMASMVVSVPAGRVRPYGLFGFGFIRQRTQISTGSVLSDLSTDDVGYNVGGGVTIKLSRIVGVRTDLRHSKVRRTDGLSFQRFTVGIVLGG